MFCKNCGTEVSDNAKFCPKCGQATSAQIPQPKKVIEDNHIKFQLKPEFNIPYKVTTIIGRAFLYMFFICFFFSNLYRLWFIFPSTLLVTLVIMGLYIVIKLIFEKMQYDDLEYNFYNTKVDYKDGFINKEEKELKYKYIREVTMSQNILERLCDIGTIRIFTNASSGYYGGNNHNSMRGRNGLYIHCVENVQEQYRKIKQIIDEGTSESEY